MDAVPPEIQDALLYDEVPPPFQFHTESYALSFMFPPPKQTVDLKHSQFVTLSVWKPRPQLSASAEYAPKLSAKLIRDPRKNQALTHGRKRFFQKTCHNKLTNIVSGSLHSVGSTLALAFAGFLFFWK